MGQYSSFPNSSGGAIISNSGKLVGMHVASLYHEDHEHYRPPPSPRLKRGQIFATEHPMVIPSDEEKDETSIETEPNENANILLQHAVINIKSKACLGSFLSIGHIRSELLNAGLLPKQKKNSRPRKSRRR